MTTDTRRPGTSSLPLLRSARLNGFAMLLAILAVALATPPLSTQQADDEWVEVKKGLLMRDVVVGDGEEARRGRRVTVHYTGWLPDGTVFDTSKERNQVLGFRLGDGRMIQGWELGVPGMRVGGVRRLRVPAKLAYGKRGVKGRIPPNTDLEFEIELHAVSR